MNRRWIVALLVFLSLAEVNRARAQESAAATLRDEIRLVGQQKPPDTVVARIGGEPVTIAEVNRLMNVARRGKPVVEAAIPMVEATTLEQVINRRLITNFLDEKKIVVSEKEIDAAAQRNIEGITKDGTVFLDYLGHNELTEKAFREEVEWQMRWDKALRSYLTDANIQKYFDAHRREFDGSEVRVSQILLRPNGTLNVDKVKAMSDRATTIRDSIIGKLISFSAAAKKHSEAPSRTNGGDIGFIPRHGLMDEDFAAAAFALEPGEISQPVLTAYGTHLIQVTETRPGKRTAREARKEIEPAVRKEGFDKIAAQMRKATTIEYTGAISYLKPGTDELVVDEATRTKQEEGTDAKPKE